MERLAMLLNPLDLLGLPLKGEQVQDFLCTHSIRMVTAEEMGVPDIGVVFAPWLHGPGIDVDADSTGHICNIYLWGPLTSPVWGNRGCWPGALPKGLQFGHSREEVWTLLGVPTFVSSDKEKVVELWNRYDSAEYSLSVHYNHSTLGVSRLTLSMPSCTFEPTLADAGIKFVH